MNDISTDTAERQDCRKWRTRCWIIAVATFLIAGAFAPWGWRLLEAKAVGAHQLSTMRELSEWEREYSQITTAQEAGRAADMIGYVRGYYVLGPGYRSDPGTEAALEAQRARSITSIKDALERFENL